MDFCLKGSQINLVTRQKAKPKYSSQTSLHLTHLHLRPRSASLQQRKQRCSPLFCRPQSADPRFGRHLAGSVCGHYCSELALNKVTKTSKRLQSVSSSDLLKLLLDEPIKRSWLCRGVGNGNCSPETQSSLSSARKTTSNSSLHKRTPTETGDFSSVEGDYSDGRLSKQSARGDNRKVQSPTKAGKMNLATDINKDKQPFSVSGKQLNKEHWPTAASIALSYTSLKPDLPGRVSFSKPNSQNDLQDSSDCDNDKQESHYTAFQREIRANALESISAPGPVSLSLPNFSYNDKHDANESHSASALKKSVHFGRTDADGEAVLAETYEYPKCPSENCSCSTRSSSLGSLQDGSDGKCACESSTCRFIAESQQQAGNTTSKLCTDVSHYESIHQPVEESSVIRAYKNAVREKNLLEENNAKSSASYEHATLAQPHTAKKYESSNAHDYQQEKQNNFSESKASSTSTKSNDSYFQAQPQNNLPAAAEQAAKSFEERSMLKTNTSSSSETVINNYLKVASSAGLMAKKNENSITASTAKLSKSQNVTPTNRFKPKSANASTKNNGPKLKKAISFGSLREDSNLDEFNLDKIDSWMSLREQRHNDAERNMAKHASLDRDLEKFSENGLDADDDTISQLSCKSSEQSQDDSTYDEIVSVIKEIDEDKRQDNYAERAVSEMDLKLNSSNTSTARSATDDNDAEKSPDKYKDILSYLDDVEDSCDKTLLETRRSMPDTNRSEVEFIVEPDIAEDVPKLSDLLMLPNHQLARRVIALSLRANELANAIHLSKEHVFKIRSEKQKSVRAEKANTVNRLRDQKKHFESIVKRHQGFIEQLLKDKGSLCEKVAALTRRLESQNQAWEHKLDAEIARVKETTLAGEKIRRERWVRENTKKIKELTVKGLEAEINKMTANHQHEVTELKRKHQQELLDALEEARLKHEQIENGIRESCAQDREAIIEKERTAIRERFERQMEEEHKARAELKQQLCEDFAAERERLQAELKNKEMEYQTRRAEMQREFENEVEQVRNELLEKMSKQDEKYQNRINTIEKQYETDFELWKREYENSCKIAQVEKENTIRQHYRAERDRQIDAIVSRMDAEALKSAEEFENKLSRLKEKYDKDLQDAEGVEKSLREKCTDTRNKLAESDAQVRNKQAEIRQLEIELEHSKKMCSECMNERDQLRENLRNEIQNEVSTIKNERDQEIKKIHKRVQQAIEKKDATIDILQKENGSLRERCLKLEQVIRQQRKDYCVK